MTLVDNAVYVDGRRMWTGGEPPTPRAWTRPHELLRERNGTAWIGLYRPDDSEIRSVAAELERHELPVQDATRLISVGRWNGTATRALTETSPAQRRRQEDFGVGGHPVRADPGGHDLRG